MHFLSSELGGRINAFDNAIETTLSVLGRPEISTQLGGLATTLTQLADAAFLPNVRNGIVSLPPSVLLTNRIAVLPYSTGEMSAPPTLEYGMLAPTRRRFRGMAHGLANFFGLPQAAAEDILWQNIQKTEQLKVPCPDMTNHKGTSMTRFITHRIGNLELSYETRPVVCLTSGRIEKNSPKTAGTVAHELTHAYDHEHRWVQPNDPEAPVFKAWTEFRGYRGGWVIYDAAGLLDQEPKTAAVEAVRLRHATPDEPYPKTPAAVAELQQTLTFAR